MAFGRVFPIEQGGRNGRIRDTRDPQVSRTWVPGHFLTGLRDSCDRASIPRPHRTVISVDSREALGPRSVLGFLTLSLTCSINKHNLSPSLAPGLNTCLMPDSVATKATRPSTCHFCEPSIKGQGDNMFQRVATRIL